MDFIAHVIAYGVVGLVIYNIISFIVRVVQSFETGIENLMEWRNDEKRKIGSSNQWGN